MELRTPELTRLVTVITAVTLGTVATLATATEPCGDFGACKALVEINSSDGDIGFHFLMDGDDLNSARIHDPDGIKVFEDQAKGPLREQKLTETFAESAEPLCWDSPDAEEDDEIVTLNEFLERWTAGTYVFTGSGDDGEKSEGETELTYDLPAAPAGLGFDGSIITWSAGTDLGNCATYAELATRYVFLPRGQTIKPFQQHKKNKTGYGIQYDFHCVFSIALSSVSRLTRRLSLC